MQTIKKIAISIFAFLISCIIISAPLIYLFLNSEYAYYQDKFYRQELSDETDSYIIGSSRGVCGFNPKVIDKELGWSTYNLCGNSLTLKEKIMLLDEVIDYKSCKNIVIEVGYDDLFFKESKNTALCVIALLSRLSNYKNAVSYLIKEVPLDCYLYIYAQYMRNGIDVTINKLLNKKFSAVDRSSKGFVSQGTVDVTIKNSEVANTRKSIKNELIVQENYDDYVKLVEYCKNKNVIMVVNVLSESFIWKKEDMGYYYNYFKKIAEDTGVKIIDINLIKERNRYFTDGKSFFNEDHLSRQGADDFSLVFSKIIKKLNNGEDVSDMFYDSYDEAIKHFEYYDTYQRLIGEQ